MKHSLEQRRAMVDHLESSLSISEQCHLVYPYLLRRLTIERPNQVWAIDITYIPMRRGFLYLVTIIDLHSRFVLNWRLSNTMDAEWCAEGLREAIRQHGYPQIFNSDQVASSPARSLPTC